MKNDPKQASDKIKTLERYLRHLEQHPVLTPALFSDTTENVKDLIDAVDADKTALSIIDTIRDYYPSHHTLIDYSKPNHPFFYQVKPRQDILLVGNIGMAGTYLTAVKEKDEILKHFPSWVFEEAYHMKEHMLRYPSPDFLKEASLSAFFPVGEGGLRKTLYSLGKVTQKGYRIFPEEVPTNQVTIELCELFDLDPWALLSGGCLLLVTPDGTSLLRRFRKEGFPAAIIGYTTDDKDKLLYYGETESRINRPSPDAFLQLLLRELENFRENSSNYLG